MVQRRFLHLALGFILLAFLVPEAEGGFGKKALAVALAIQALKPRFIPLPIPLPIPLKISKDRHAFYPVHSKSHSTILQHHDVHGGFGQGGYGEYDAYGGYGQGGFGGHEIHGW